MAQTNGAADNPKASATSERFFALDMIRVVLTLLVTVFHALSELTWTLTSDEVDALLKHPAGRLIPLGYTAVDGFFVLTGLLAVEKTLRYWSKPSTGSRFSDLVNVYYTRMIQIGMPLFMVVCWYAFFFRDGKYPELSVRNEEALLTMRMLHNGSNSDEIVSRRIRDSGMSLWPFLALYINNMTPFGGVLQQTWSLSVQMQWYLFLPLTPFLFYIVKKAFNLVMCKRNAPVSVELTARGLLWVCGIGILLSGIARIIAHFHLAQFNPSFLVGHGVHFFWYADTYTRISPILAGAVAGILSMPEYSQLQGWCRNGGSTKLSVLARNILVSLMAVIVVGCCFVNAFWKDLTGRNDEAETSFPHSAMYVLCRPGGTLSAVAYSWVTYSAMHGISWLPIFPVKKEKVDNDIVDKSPAEKSEAALESPKQPPSIRQRRKPTDSKIENDQGESSKVQPVKQTSKSRPLWRRLVTYLVPITYTVYLVNSTLYEQFYGWPQRLHPCPALLSKGSLELSEIMIHNHTEVFDQASFFHPLNPHINKLERTLTDGITASLQFLRGPSTLYCHEEAGATVCDGMCFTNEQPDVRSKHDLSCLLTHSCTSPSVDAPVPAKAWLQFWHYSLICVAATWGLAWLMYVFVEGPLGMLLMSGPVKKLLLYPVFAHAIVCMLVSIAVHIYVHHRVWVAVNLELERSIISMHFD